MANRHDGAKALLEKIQSLPPDRMAEVEDFVDFLRERDRRGSDRALTRMGMAATQPLLEAIWDNPDDAEYDRL